MNTRYTNGRYAKARSMNARYANSKYANAMYVNARYANARYANTRNANARYANARYENARYTNARYVNTRYVNARYTNTRYTNTRYANGRYANSRYVNTRYTNVRYTNVRYTNTRYANARYANGRYANARYANLKYMNARYTNAGQGALEWVRPEIGARALESVAVPAASGELSLALENPGLGRSGWGAKRGWAWPRLGEQLPSPPIVLPCPEAFGKVRWFILGSMIALHDRCAAPPSPESNQSDLGQGNNQDQNRYQPICQTYKNKSRYMTLYDTEQKIPVFSAYKYIGNISNSKRPKWMIEPQLEDEATAKITTWKKIKTTNYYTRLQKTTAIIFPRTIESHANEEDDQLSTFTLTIIVPQVISFNGGSWKNMESGVKCVMDKYCVNQNRKPEAFVLTGAIPSNSNYLMDNEGKNKKNINIPKTLWTAFCCQKGNGEWIASAHWGDNVEKQGTHMVTLGDLKTTFKIEPFPGDKCQKSSKVSEYYKNLDKASGLDQSICGSYCCGNRDDWTISLREHTPNISWDPHLQPVMMSSVMGGCSLALVMLLLVSIEAEVTELSDCSEYFLGNIPPEIPGVVKKRNIQDQNRYKPICQTYKNKSRYMTLYDTDKKIPVFSAYKYTGNIPGIKRPNWMMEPQLEDGKADPNMNDERMTTFNQASDDDYRKIFWHEKESHANDKDDQESTCTLTNAVPQATSFNGGSWANMESCVKCVMDDYCVNQNGIKEAFVLTGAIPSDREGSTRVNIPKTLWTAFCCYGNRGWIASAHWGDNVKETGENFMVTRTLGELNTNLGIQPFLGEQCPKDSTVRMYYEDYNRRKQTQCKCLSTTRVTRPTRTRPTPPIPTTRPTPPIPTRPPLPPLPPPTPTTPREHRSWFDRTRAREIPLTGQDLAESLCVRWVHLGQFVLSGNRRGDPNAGHRETETE
ncbi:Endonuclease domain-containing 1 protein [Merluccius polli]|uniref:Endonuclease domain-containing 1 protein n=1 Tax=Merluccius polli TaxID=89951 RepID=A0AA47MZ89_MERPO|nr:Endonuclease domain-containing 1 protein [Merluccius polli]